MILEKYVRRYNTTSCAGPVSKKKKQRLPRRSARRMIPKYRQKCAGSHEKDYTSVMVGVVRGEAEEPVPHFEASVVHAGLLS